MSDNETSDSTYSSYDYSNKNVLTVKQGVKLFDPISNAYYLLYLANVEDELTIQVAVHNKPKYLEELNVPLDYKQPKQKILDVKEGIRFYDDDYDAYFIVSLENTENSPSFQIVHDETYVPGSDIEHDIVDAKDGIRFHDLVSKVCYNVVVENIYDNPSYKFVEDLSFYNKPKHHKKPKPHIREEIRDMLLDSIPADYVLSMGKTFFENEEIDNAMDRCVEVFNDTPPYTIKINKHVFEHRYRSLFKIGTCWQLYKSKYLYFIRKATQYTAGGAQVDMHGQQAQFAKQIADEFKNDFISQVQPLKRTINVSRCWGKIG